jgi:type II restriction enzyme
MIRQPYKNQSRYDKYKRTLLEWAAVMLADNPETDIHTCIAIPSNPDYPRPYSRWRIAGMLDMKYELKVAEEFWDFLDSNN